MYLYDLTEAQIIAFFLVFVRILAFFLTTPLFSMGNVPNSLRILFSMVCTFMLYPIINFDFVAEATFGFSLVALIIHEILAGLFLGFITQMLFFAVNMMGQLVSLSIGLANAQIFNPSAGTQTSIIDQFQVTLVALFYLAINGHHYFITGLVESFNLIPVSEKPFNSNVFTGFIDFTYEIIVIGLNLAMPVLIAVLMMNIAMGIIGRAVPQINVLITSLPVNILVGILVLLISLPLFFDEINTTLNFVTERLFEFMKAV